MKKLLIPAAIAAALAISTSASAGSATSNFNVTVTLSSQCSATNSGTPTVAFGTYTAFGAAIGPVAVTPAVGFSCTRGLASSVAFDVAGGGANGVIAGLQYTLTAPTDTVTAGSAPVVGGAAGTPDAHSITFSGNMAGGQAGTCAGASCAATDATRQIIISF